MYLRLSCSFGAVSEETQNAEIPDTNAGGCDLEPVLLALDTAVAQQQVRRDHRGNLLHGGRRTQLTC